MLILENDIRRWNVGGIYWGGGIYYETPSPPPPTHTHTPFPIKHPLLQLGLNFLSLLGTNTKITHFPRSTKGKYWYFNSWMKFTPNPKNMTFQNTKWIEWFKKPGSDFFGLWKISLGLWKSCFGLGKNYEITKFSFSCMKSALCIALLISAGACFNMGKRSRENESSSRQVRCYYCIDLILKVLE